MRHAIDHIGVKGSVLVIKDGQQWLKYATANSADTSYLINSVQKSMTATMVMRAVQKKKLSLNTKLSKFYDNVPGADQVTIANLLNMTSGLDLKKGKKLGSKNFISDEDNLNKDIAKTVFHQKQFGKWHYTSLNYVYLCGILSQIENKSYEQLFRNTYIKSLKLKNSEFLWAGSEKLRESHWTAGHEYRNGRYKRVKISKAIEDAHNELGAGSVVMSNADLVKTMHAIIAGNLLTNKSRAILFKGKAPRYYNGGYYNYPEYKMANGAGAGYYTFFRSSNDGKQMIVIQANKTKSGKFKKLRDQVNEIMTMLLDL